MTTARHMSPQETAQHLAEWESLQEWERELAEVSKFNEPALMELVADVYEAEEEEAEQTVYCPTCGGSSYLEFVSSEEEGIGYFVDCPDCFNGLVKQNEAQVINRKREEESAWCEYYLARERSLRTEKAHV